MEERAGFQGRDDVAGSGDIDQLRSHAEHPVECHGIGGDGVIIGGKAGEGLGRAGQRRSPIGGRDVDSLVLDRRRDQVDSCGGNRRFAIEQ